MYIYGLYFKNYVDFEFSNEKYMFYLNKAPLLHHNKNRFCFYSTRIDIFNIKNMGYNSMNS
jgi:hypothetical protein